MAKIGREKCEFNTAIQYRNDHLRQRRKHATDFVEFCKKIESV